MRSWARTRSLSAAPVSPPRCTRTARAATQALTLVLPTPILRPHSAIRHPPSAIRHPSQFIPNDPTPRHLAELLPTRLPPTPQPPSGTRSRSAHSRRARAPTRPGASRGPSWPSPGPSSPACPWSRSHSSLSPRGAVRLPPSPASDRAQRRGLLRPRAVSRARCRRRRGTRARRASCRGAPR